MFVYFFLFRRADSLSKRSDIKEQCQGTLPELPSNRVGLHQEGMSQQHRRSFGTYPCYYWWVSGVAADAKCHPLPVVPLEVIKRRKKKHLNASDGFCIHTGWSGATSVGAASGAVWCKPPSKNLSSPCVQASWSPPFPQRGNFKHGPSCYPSCATCSTLRTTTPARSKPNLPCFLFFNSPKKSIRKYYPDREMISRFSPWTRITPQSVQLNICTVRWHLPPVVFSDAVVVFLLCVCVRLRFWFDSLSVYVRVSGLVWSTAEDLRGLVGAAGQRRSQPASQHYDPQIPPVLQALQPQDKVLKRDRATASIVLSNSGWTWCITTSDWMWRF